MNSDENNNINKIDPEIPIKRGRGRPKKIPIPVVKYTRMEIEKTLIIELPLTDDEEEYNFTNDELETSSTINNINYDTDSTTNYYNKNTIYYSDNTNTDINNDDNMNTDEYELSRSIDIILQNKINKYNNKILDLNLINIINNKPIVVDNTNICCWWCSERFNNMPCFLPERITTLKNKEYFLVFGCFCSFPCAKAYNININDNRVPIRNILLKQIYEEIFDKDEDIPVAPNKELLNKFGGPLDINEYRNIKYICDKNIKFKYPPVLPLNFTIELS